MADQFVGEIRAVGFNFAPVGWALCNGQLLPISQNTALFSLLGTNFGGNGTSDFGLPNLQGCVPMGFGDGTGLTPRLLGELGGSQTITLLDTQIPAHGHGLNGSSSAATTPIAQGNLAALTTRPTYAAAGSLSPKLNAATIEGAGSSQPHNNLQPTLVVNFIIALQGIYPPRN
jgi:microcystin-dependent protein